MLTQKDLGEIEKIVDKSINSRTKFLPTKDEFYSKMDELIGEIKASRQGHNAITTTLSQTFPNF